MIGDSNDEYNFLDKVLLTNTQLLSLHKAFVNNPLTNIKLLETQLHKIWQSGGFPSRLLWQAAASASNAAIQKNIFRSGMTTLIISNEEINDIMKIVKSLEESGLLIKGVSKTIKSEAKEQKGRFCDMY